MSDTIDNPRGGKVLKVANFDKLKTKWNKYDHRIVFTDFELNEFLSKLYRKIPNFNLDKYLFLKKNMWKNFKLHFPNAKMRDFNNQFINDDFIIYYKDTPIKVFGGDVNVNKLNDQVKESLGITDNFPISLQLTLEKYPIPGTDYQLKPRSILNEFKISVSKTESFMVKFKDIFKESTITFKSAAQCNRWQSGPNFNYWPQQLNCAVWCATSGCGLSLNDDYPDRIKEFINFHIYFTISRILWKLKIPLPDDKVFNQTSNYFEQSEYLSLCQEFNIDSNSDFRFRGGKNHGLGTIFVHGSIPPIASGIIDWPNSTPIFHDEHGIGFMEGKIINLANDGKPFEWFSPIEGKGITRPGLGRLNQSIEAFVYCIVGSEVNMRSSIADGGGGGVNTQKEMMKLFEKAVILDDLAQSVQRYQLAIQEAKLRLDFAFAPDVWLMPSDMIINTESVIGYNNFLKKASGDMVFGENKLLNNENKKVGVSHNLGVHKTILPHIVEKLSSNRIKRVVTDDSDNSDNKTRDQFVRIENQNHHHTI